MLNPHFPPVQEIKAMAIAVVVVDALSDWEKWVLLQTYITHWNPQWHPRDIKHLLEMHMIESDGCGVYPTMFGKAVRLHCNLSQQGESA